MPVNPTTQPTSAQGRLADAVSTLERKTRALHTRNLPTEYVRQSRPGVTQMTVDQGSDSFVMLMGASEATTTVTPTVSPLDSIILVNVRNPYSAGGQPTNQIAYTVTARNSTLFALRFVHFADVPANLPMPADRTYDFDWVLVHWDAV